MGKNDHDPSKGDEIELPDGGIVTVDVMDQPDDPMTGVLISYYVDEESAAGRVESAAVLSVQQWDHVQADVMKIIRKALIERSKR